MTEEGIIQKVCRGYDSEIAVSIELELIEEIKQTLSEYYERGALQKLIGDAQE